MVLDTKSTHFADFSGKIGFHINSAWDFILGWSKF